MKTILLKHLIRTFCFSGMLLVALNLSAKKHPPLNELFEKWAVLENDPQMREAAIEEDLQELFELRNTLEKWNTLSKVVQKFKESDDLPFWALCGYENWKTAYKLRNDTLLLKSLMGMREIYRRAGVPMFEKFSLNQSRAMVHKDSTNRLMQIDTLHIHLLVENKEPVPALALIENCFEVCSNYILPNEDNLKLNLMFWKAQMLLEQEKCAEAYKILSTAEPLALLKNRQDLIPKIILYRATCLLKQDKFEDHFTATHKGLNLCELMDDSVGAAKFLLLKAQMHEKLKQPQLSIENYLKAERMLPAQKPFSALLLQIVSNLSQQYTKIGEERNQMVYLQKEKDLLELRNQKLKMDQAGLVGLERMIGKVHSNVYSLINEVKTNYFMLIFAAILVLVLLVISYLIWRSKSISKKHNNVLLKTNEELERLTVESNKANALKTSILNNLTHEMKTPLNAIVGISDILRNNNETDKKASHLKYLQFSAHQLTHLIDDLLVSNLLLKKDLTLVPNEFELLDLLHNIASTHRISAKQKGLLLNTEIDPLLPVQIKTDEKRLIQILDNLLDNAIKFTEQGAVVINVQKVNEKDQIARIKFTVRDSGIGIEQKMQTEIFNFFTQEKADIDRKHEGVGNGLSIAKELVELLGGELKVKSSLGNGSVFWFIAPFDVLEKAAPDTAILANEKDEKDSVLIIDDNRINLTVAQNLLRLEGVVSDVCSGGVEGWETFKKKRHSRVLLDLQMPELDGFQVAKLIKEFAPETKIIALTAGNLQDFSNRTEAKYFDDFIGKPYSRNELIEKLRTPETQNFSSGIF